VFIDRPEASALVVREVVAFARRQGVWFLIIQPPEARPGVDPAVASAGFRLNVPSIAPEATLRLDLRRSEEELFGAMKSERRRTIRKVLRSEFEVREEQDIELFHHLHALTATRQGFVPVSLRNLRAQWDALAPGRHCAVLIAYYNGSPVAGSWLTSFAGTVTGKLLGWDKANGPSHVNEGLRWATIQWARQSGAHTYDQGGFDRRGAELMIRNMPFDEGFHKTPSYHKLGFGGAPILLPRAPFKFTLQLVDTAIGRVAQHFLMSTTARKLAYRFRNG
jgi:Acetyltransferase (GNAT) domain